MPIPPILQQTLALHCLACGWKATWQPKSDAQPLPPAVCPKCGSTDLDLRPAARLGAALRPLRGR